jgi:type II secretory pathway pseudopilin PulG
MKIKWLRVLIAIVVGIVISTISIYVAWQNSNHAPAAWFQQWKTQRQLKDIGQAIIAYQQKFNTSPNTFEQLRTMTNDVPWIEYDFENGFVDGWQHSLIFTNEGTNCLVISHGGDGKPGGKGIDYDLTSNNPHPKESSPTLAQFFDNKECEGMIDWSFIRGGLAALLSLLTVRVPNLNKRGIIILILSLCATLIGTFFVTTIITALHIPSGH